MKVTNISCRNFRNIESCSVSLNPEINVIIGNNGQGKTNFLESLYYLSTTRSFRINSDQELIMHDKPLAKIECRIEDEENIKNISCVIHDKGKSCFLGNKQIPRASEFIGFLNAVLFAPTDLEIFTASPRLRRKLIDVEIGKLDRSYSVELNRYNHLLKERNASLKQEKLDETFLDVIELQMAEVQLNILKKRFQFVDFINQQLSQRYFDISNEKTEILCEYKGIINQIEEDSLTVIQEKLKANRQKDWFLKSTSYGIHRDDLIFLMNGLLLDSIASQGQRRMTVLALKMTFVDFVLEKTGKKPILLLDDVLSELDIEKRKNLFKAIPKGIQTVITTTDLNDIIEDLPNQKKIFRMNKGQLD